MVRRTLRYCRRVELQGAPRPPQRRSARCPGAMSFDTYLLESAWHRRLRRIRKVCPSAWATWLAWNKHEHLGVENHLVARLDQRFRMMRCRLWKRHRSWRLSAANMDASCRKRMRAVHACQRVGARSALCSMHAHATCRSMNSWLCCCVHVASIIARCTSWSWLTSLQVYSMCFLSFSLSLCFSYSLSLCLCSVSVLSVCVNLPLSLSFSLCLCLCLCARVSVCVCLSLSLSLSVATSLRCTKSMHVP